MKIRNTLYLAITFYLSITFSYAQTPTWKVNPANSIHWMRITPLGSLIVSTSEGIKGIDPENGNVIWTTSTSLSNAPESSFKVIENTPFFSVQSGEGNNEDFCIIESFEGKLVFSSAQSGMQKVNSQYFLHQSGAILVLGSEFGSKDPSICMIDMTTGNKLWQKEPSYGIVTACKDLGNNECIITTGFFVIKLDVKTGKEIWRKIIDPKFEGMTDLLATLDKGTANVFDPSQITATIVTSEYYQQGVFVGIQTTKQKQVTDSKGNTTTQTLFERNYMGFNLADGSYLWSSIKNYPGTLGIIYTHEKGLIVSQGEYPKNIPNLVQTAGADLNMMSYSSGEGTWGKKGNGLNIKGGILRTIVPVENDLLLVSGKENNFIDLVNATDGASLISKEVKVNGQVEYVSKTKMGILYATNEEVNIIDQVEGKKVFEKSFKATASLLLEFEDYFVVFNDKDKMLYEVSTSSGQMKAISPIIELEGKSEIKNIEKLTEGYFLSSDQNVVLVNNNSIVYNKYFPPPTENAWKKTLFFANAVLATFRSFAYAANAGLYGAASQSVQVNNALDKFAKDYTQKISNAYGDAAKSNFKYAIKMIEKANKRFTSTQQNKNQIFILTSPDKKTAELIRVDKRTGEVLNTIYLNKDKTPMYELDGIENRVFYKSSPNTLEGYQY